MEPSLHSTGVDGPITALHRVHFQQDGVNANVTQQCIRWGHLQLVHMELEIMDIEEDITLHCINIVSDCIMTS